MSGTGIRYCSDRVIHAGHEWYDPAIHHDCPGLLDETAVLAARFFDDNYAAADQRAGLPQWMTEQGKQQYIADIAASPRSADALRVMYPPTDTEAKP